MSEKRNRLTKALGRTDIIALGFGTMVGWSWVVLATTWITEAGFWGAIIAFLIGGALIFAIGLTYGELTAALPLSGGELVYAYRAAGKYFAMLVGWIMTLAYVGVAAWEGIAVATAFNYIFPIPQTFLLWDIAGYSVYFSWAVVGVLGAIIMVVLNLFGTRPAIIFQVMATAAVIAISLMLLLGGITFGSTENIGSAFTSFSGFFYVMLLVPSMLVGFDVIPQSSEEMNISPKHIGKMVMVCIVVSLIWYFIIIVGIGLSAPLEIRGSGILPTAEVMGYVYGNSSFGTILVIVGILGIMTSWNGFFMGATRLIFAMGRAKMLPPVFGKLGKKHKTPWAATLTVGAICIVAPFLGRNALIWLVNISSICALFSYCCVTLSFVLIRKKEPELTRPIKIKGGIKLGIFIFIAAVTYLMLYIFMALEADSYKAEMAVIFAWLVVGVILYNFTQIRSGVILASERERLIFGDKLARVIGEKNEKK